MESEPIQQWFFDQDFDKPNHWNQSFLVCVPELDLVRLEASIAKLVEHHDAFRLRYKSNDNGTTSQCYDASAVVEKLKVLDIRTLGHKIGTKKFEAKLQEVLTQWQSDFDIDQGPLYTIGYIYGYQDGSSRIYFALHHLIVDTVSWRILTEDLKNLYNGRDVGLKGSSYRQWVATVGSYANEYKVEKDYWKELIDDYKENKFKEKK